MKQGGRPLSSAQATRPPRRQRHAAPEHRQAVEGKVLAALRQHDRLPPVSTAPGIIRLSGSPKPSTDTPAMGSGTLATSAALRSAKGVALLE